MARDMEQHAKDRAAELMHGKTDTISALRDEVEGLEEDFDGDSYAPYYNQKQEVIDEYERGFGSDAEDLCDQGKEYKASEYMEAMSAYANAIGYSAFQHYFTEAKDEFAEAVDDIEAALSERDLDTDDCQVSISSSDPFGWSSHDREQDAPNGNVYCIHESGQLDGSNGISMRVWDGLWVSFTWSPEKPTRCDQCTALMINGVFCHETGCPNTHSQYDAESDTWIKQRKCFECGCTVDADDPCCSAPCEDDTPEITTFGELSESEA